MADPFFQISIFGVKEVKKALKGKTVQQIQSAVRAGVSRGASVIAREMRKNAPQLGDTQTSDGPVRPSKEQIMQGTPGRLKRSIGIKRKTYRGSGNITAFIGGQIAKQGGRLGHLVELGTGDRPHPLTGTSGFMPEFPFMGASFNRTRSLVKRAIVAEVKRALKS